MTRDVASFAVLLTITMGWPLEAACMHVRCRMREYSWCMLHLLRVSARKWSCILSWRSRLRVPSREAPYTFSAYCDPLFRPMETTSAHVNSNRTSKAMLAPALLDHLTREVI